MAVGWGGRERVEEYLVSSREETLGWVAGDYEDGKARRRGATAKNRQVATGWPKVTTIGPM
jgi:hypothetical protein